MFQTPSPKTRSRTKNNICQAENSGKKITTSKGSRQNQNEEEGLTPRKNIVYDPKGSPKIIYLIRHGESLGQKADRPARKTDARLRDCGLSKTGIWQAATRLPELLGEDKKAIELVVSSPLTRALQTACLAFQDTDTPILCHYHLREIGSMIPENIPRPIKQVLKDLKEKSNINNEDRIDVASLQPAHWPKNHDTPPRVVRRDRIREVFQWMHSRQETVIAVVCHYHVIRAALQDPYNAAVDVSPSNCVPIKCHLADGRLSRVP